MTQSAWWLVAAVLVVPLAIMPLETGISTTQAKNAVMIVLGLAVVVWRLPSAWLQGFAAWAILAFVVSGMPAWGIAGLLGILAWLLIYGEASRLPESAWRRVRAAIAGAAIVQIAWMLVQRIGLDPIFVPISYAGSAMPGPPPAIGWFANPMDTSLFLGLSLPAMAALGPAMGWRRHLVGGLMLTLGAAAIISLNASSGLVAAAMTVLWWAPGCRWRTALAAVLVVGAAWFIAARDPGGFGHRPVIWRTTAALAVASPVVGWGPNALGYRLHLTRHTPGRVVGEERWEHAFNEWLQGAVELGLAGPALAFGYLASLGWRLRRRWTRAQEALPGALALLLVSTFSIPVRLGPVALLGALYLGRLEAVAREAA